MTNEELIKILQDMPQDHTVMIPAQDGGNWYGNKELENVEVWDNEKVIYLFDD